MAERVSFPNVTASLVPETPTVSIDPKVTTIIGQMATGTATSGVRLVDIDLLSQDALFGANSQVTAMINAFRAVNKTSQLDVIPLADAGGATSATGSIAFSGTATASGTINVYIASVDRLYSVAVANGDTATNVGDTFEALVTADTKALASASNTTGTVTLTAVNGGTVANKYTIEIDGSVAGITAVITAFASGASDPSMTSLEDLLVDKTDVVMPYEYVDTAILALLDARFNISNNVLDGRLIMASTDTKANLVTAGDAENSQSLVILGDKPVNTSIKKGSAIVSPDFERSAQFAGIRTLRLEDGTAIADFMTTTSALDNIGGVHTSTIPYANTATLLPVVPSGEGFSASEVSDLTDSGISVMGNNLANNTLICGEILTTYKTNVAGFADLTYKYLNYVDTSTASREFIWKSLKIDNAQRRLTLGQGVAGYDFATIGGVRAEMVGYYLTLTGNGYVLLQGGNLEDGRSITDIYKDNLTVAFDIKQGEITITSILPLVTQVRTIIAPLNIRFNINEIAS
jgi:phage tail sheath gpL-like